MGKKHYITRFGQKVRARPIKCDKVGFTRGPATFDLRDLDNSLMPGSERLPCACALVEVMLKLNKSLDNIFLDIKHIAKQLDILEYIHERTSNTAPMDEGAITEVAKKIQSFLDGSQGKQGKDLIYKFIRVALTPPRKLETYYTYDGDTKFNFARRGNRIIVPEKLSVLCRAVLLHALCIAHDVDFYEIDRLRRDYNLVSSTKKPTTDQDRACRVELKSQCKKMRLHFINYDVLLERARKFYRAYVLEASCADVASDYGIVTSTLSHETQIFRDITGF